MIPIVSGWEPGAELSETICKQSDSEESDGATETFVGVISPECSFGEDCEPKGRSERHAGLSEEVGTKSVTRASDSKNSSKPHRGAPWTSRAVSLAPWRTTPPCGQTSQELTPSENSGVLAGDELLALREGTHHLRGLWGHSPDCLGGTPEELPLEDALHLQLVRESLPPQHAPGAAPGRAHWGKAPCV